MRDFMFSLQWKCCYTPLLPLSCASLKCHCVVTWIFKHLEKMQWLVVKQHTSVPHSSKYL